MTAPWATSNARRTPNRRGSPRSPVTLAARLTWKDQRGSDCFASVVVRDVSESGAFVEVPSPVSISVFRLTQFQIERDGRASEVLPAALRQGRLMAAVYRIRPATKAGGKQGLALRLLVPPRRADGDLPQPDRFEFANVATAGAVV